MVERLTPAQPPLAYDRLARLGVHRWWMPPVAVLAAAVAALVVMCGVVGGGTVAGQAFGMEVDLDSAETATLPPLADNLVLLAGLAAMIPVVLLVARLVQRRPAGTLHSVSGRIRWRWLALCVAPAALSTALLLAGMVLLGDDTGEPTRPMDWPRFLLIAAALVVLVPLQAAGEEYATRGFLLQTLGTYGRWAGVAGSAVIFAALHGFGGWPGFAALMASGVVWALLVIRTGGLEVAIVAHAMTNLVAMLIGAAYGDLDQAVTASAADADLTAALLLLGADLVYALVVLGLLRLLARRRPHLLPATTTPVPLPPPAGLPPGAWPPAAATSPLPNTGFPPP